MPDSDDQDKTARIEAPSVPKLCRENAGRILGDMLGSGSLAGMEKAGDRVGPYQLCEMLGEGGFGNVWRAEQTEVVKREVALKVIKRGMDTAQVLGRFNQERQALASLEHPNIARILEVGATPDGRPYFAMELVRGAPVTEWCEARQTPLHERLGMFIQICHAVQHAHGKGILHRDIKPNNVLVTDAGGRPAPKVIDFGIAKAMAGSTLADVTMLTQEDQVIGTPAYMSPEQIEGSRGLDARSDVYSLGVLLYELLTASLPFDARSLGGVEKLRQMILETVPERPSTRVRRRTASHAQGKAARDFGASLYMLPADLDWITMRALEKDSRRRYASAAELAADVQRHLDSEPVLARPPSLGYRAGRWMRRHRTANLVAAAALLSGAIVARWPRAPEPGAAASPAYASRPLQMLPAYHPSNLITVNFEFPPSRTAEELAELSVTNNLGMKFLPVTIHGGPTDKQQVLFSIWLTRVQDYRVFAEETQRPWEIPSFEQGPGHPAVHVSWNDANDFCAWLTERERKAGTITADQSYRLPGDHEWSCAAGIGELEDATLERPDNRIGRRPAVYPWGALAKMPDYAGNYLSAECGPDIVASSDLGRSADRGPPSYRDGHAFTSPVGRYRMNHLGLYDMGGNVWQWTAEASPPPARMNRIIRGGSWKRSGMFAAALSRRDGGLEHAGKEETGFRVVLAAHLPESPAVPPPLSQEAK